MKIPFFIKPCFKTLLLASVTEISNSTSPCANASRDLTMSSAARNGEVGCNRAIVASSAICSPGCVAKKSAIASFRAASSVARAGGRRATMTPRSAGAEITSSMSVDKYTRSAPAACAALRVCLYNGTPFNSRRFLPGNPLEPARIGITPTQLVLFIVFGTEICPCQLDLPHYLTRNRRLNSRT